MGQVFIYLGMATFGVVIALSLARFAGLQFQIKINRGKRKTALNLPSEPLRRAVFKEVSGFVVSKENQEKVTRAITALVNSEVDRKTSQVTNELTQKYETVIQEKERNEKFAWTKYKKTLSEKKGTDAVIRSIAQGLVVVDSEGKVIMMNPAAEKLLEASKKEKIGKPILEDLKDSQLVSLTKEIDQGKDKEIELVSQEDDTKKTLRASSAVIENENGQTIGMVSVLSDVTKQKELDSLKSNFVTNVTHELRTPLIAIDKSISLLRSQATGPVSETQEQFLSIAERNLKRLGRLINDLLDLSKLEAGRMTIEPQPSSIDKVISDSLDTFNAWASAKSINVGKETQEGLPEINFDPHRITQVITNLVGNAIKFTPQGGKITIKASLNSDKKAIRVGVKDTGVGIPKEDLPKIFDKFYQTGERAPTDISGTGLGLSICREIVELHKGKIWAESEENKGAEFIFTLPLQT